MATPTKISPINLDVHEQWIFIITASSAVSVIATSCVVHTLRNSKSKSISKKIIQQIKLTCLLQAIAMASDYIFLLGLKLDQAVIFPTLAYLLNFMSLGWTAALSIYSYRVVTQPKVFNKIKFYNRSYITIVLISFLVIVPIYMLVVNCAKKELFYKLWNTVLSAIAIFGSISISLYCSKKQVAFVKENYSQDLIKSANVKLGKLTRLPVYQALIYSPLLWQSLISIADEHYQTNNVYQGVCLAYSLAGAFNALLYRTSKEMTVQDDDVNQEDLEIFDKSADLDSEKILERALIH